MSNADLKVPQGELVSLELHDARLSGLALEAHSGKCVVSFAHLAGFHERDPDVRYDVWSYRAVLSLEGIDSIVLTGGPLESRGYVNTGSIIAAGKESELLAALGGLRGGLRVEFGFFNGAELRIGAEDGRLELVEAPEFLQEWCPPR